MYSLHEHIRCGAAPRSSSYSTSNVFYKYRVVYSCVISYMHYTMYILFCTLYRVCVCVVHVDVISFYVH